MRTSPVARSTPRISGRSLSPSVETTASTGAVRQQRLNRGERAPRRYSPCRWGRRSRCVRPESPPRRTSAAGPSSKSRPTAECWYSTMRMPVERLPGEELLVAPRVFARGVAVLRGPRRDAPDFKRAVLVELGIARRPRRKSARGPPPPLSLIGASWLFSNSPLRACSACSRSSRMGCGCRSP